MTVAEALDRVLEILRTTELYSPQLASKEDDPHTNDLVGGLMSVSEVSGVIRHVYYFLYYKHSPFILKAILFYFLFQSLILLYNSCLELNGTTDYKSSQTT